jgi:hypothetical protein
MTPGRCMWLLSWLTAPRAVQRRPSCSNQIRPDALTSTIRIALARCAAYNMPVPDFLRGPEKLIGGLDEAMTTPGEPEPPRDKESAHKATTQDGEGGHK